MGDEEDIAVPNGWVVKYSQSKEPGRPYYVRLSDGHRQWDPPVEHRWEVIVAVVILAAVGLYPSSGDPGDSSAVLTHGGCTCAPYTYEGDRTIGAGCIPDAGGDNIGWCDVEPGCAAAKDVTEDSDGWDTCTPAVFFDAELEYDDTAGAGLATEAATQTQDVPSASFEATAENESAVWHEDQANIDNGSEATADESTIHGDESFTPSGGQGEELPRRCSDIDPCPSLYDCQLDEDLDYSVCVYSDTRQRGEENLLSMFQAKAGTPVQVQRVDTAVADAVRAKVKEDPKGARAGAAPGRLEPGKVAQEAVSTARDHPSSRPGGHGLAAGGRGSLPNGRPNGRPQSREQMQARAEAAARAREAAAAAERDRRAAEREAEIVAEQAAQANFERQMSTVATFVRWSGAMLAWLVIFECSPSLHNGFYKLCVWLLCGARCFICFGTWLVASLSRCSSASSTGVHVEAEPQAAAGAGSESSSPVLSVVVVPAPGELLPWRVVWRRLIEQTSEHDRTEFIFVGTSNLDAWAGDVLDRMPRYRLQPRFVMYEPLVTQCGNEIDEVEAFRAGAAHANGGCILFVPSDVLLPPGYDQQVREELLTEPSLDGNSYTFAGVFRFGIYPRALSLRIQQEEQAIDRLEQRLATAVAGATTAGSIENGHPYDEQQHLNGLSNTRTALRASPITADLVRYSAATTAALESELITRRQQFIKLVSEPMSNRSNPHVEPGQRALLPIGVLAVEVCARLCAWLFQCPRLEHGFFMRTADFLHLTDEMGIATPSNEVSTSISAGRRDGSTSRSKQACAVDEQRHSADAHNTSSTHYVRATRSRYHELNERLRHAAWRSSPLHGGSGGQPLRGCGRIVEVAPVQFDRGCGYRAQYAAFGCSARWEGEGDDRSGSVRLLLWQELMSQLAHCSACFSSTFGLGKVSDAE